MNKKYIIAISYTDDSSDRVNGLLDILASTTESNNRYCDLCIYVRFDSKNPPKELVYRLKEKFQNVCLMEARPRLMQLLQSNFIVPNLFKQIKNEIGINRYKTADWDSYKAILLIDKNSCPISKDWMSVLDKEWNESECHCMGSWLYGNPVIGDMTNCVGHINQNAMYSLEIIKKCLEISENPNWSSWDTFYAVTFREAGWQGTYTIRFCDRALDSHELTEILNNCRAVLINGVPDDSVRNYFLSLK